jgi:pSer/pThr/pTyr-binding forkhead associated (FHA) protein
MQKWTFEDVPVIKIGRAADNHVVLHSSVVSRHHVEVRNVANHWEIISLGNNGTFIDGVSIDRVPIADGMIVSLAISGPQLQINLGETTHKAIQKVVPSKQIPSQANNIPERATFVFFADEEDEEHT